jgi:hypothetical protein
MQKTLAEKKPSFTGSIAKAFASKKISPRCPHARATFQWRDLSNKRKPKKWKVTGYRVLFSNLVTMDDIKFEWVKGTPVPFTILEGKVRYPDMINYPIEMCGLVKDKNGNLVFHANHACTQAFADEIEGRQESDGYVYEKFHINFDVEQDPKFVNIETMDGEAELTGFDLLKGQWHNADGELCDFKLLQILIKEKDLEENRSGSANGAYCGVVGSSNVATSTSPFATPSTGSAAKTAPPFTGSDARTTTQELDRLIQ